MKPRYDFKDSQIEALVCTLAVQFDAWYVRVTNPNTDLIWIVVYARKTCDANQVSDYLRSRAWLSRWRLVGVTVFERKMTPIEAAEFHPILQEWCQNEL